jgi:hypothetical protein
VIPGTQRRTLLRRFGHLRERWGLPELKGRLLSENQIDQTINLCRRYDPLLFVRAIDLNHQSPDELAAFRAEQARRMTSSLTPKHQRSIREEAEQIAEYIRRMPEQLLTQGILTIQLIDDVLRGAIPYYSLRRPEELGAFGWRVDAKDHFETEGERLWRLLLLPFLQMISVRQPHIHPSAGDYSHFGRFESASLPEYVKQYAAQEDLKLQSGGQPIDLGEIVRGDFELSDSSSDLGLQLVDVLASALRRAMMGTLNRTAWKRLGSLMCSQVAMSRLSTGGDKTVDNTIRDSVLIEVMAQIDRCRKRFP